MKTIATILLCGLCSTQAATIHNPSRSVGAGGAIVPPDGSSTTDTGPTSLNVDVGIEFDYYPIDQRGGYAVNANQQSSITPDGVSFTGRTSGFYHAHLTDVYGYSSSVLNVDFELSVPTSYVLSLSYAVEYGYGSAYVKWGDLITGAGPDTAGSESHAGILDPGTYHLTVRLDHFGMVDARRGPPASAGSSEQLTLNLVLADVVQVSDTGSGAMLLPLGLMMIWGRYNKQLKP